MKELFEKVQKANKEYMALINANSPEQIKALATCKKLMDEVIRLNLCTEYRLYCETLEAKKALA